MVGETPLEPRFVVWRCDHCRNGIEFDVVQLAGRTACRVPCPHCSKETGLQEPPPPPRLVPDEGWMLPVAGESTIAPAIEKSTATPRPVVVLASPETSKLPPKVLVIEPPPSSANQPAQQPPAPVPPLLAPKPIPVNLPPDPPPPRRMGGAADVRWLTDLGVVYFRQHQFGEAFLCFSRAAEQGFATAQFCLAVCYFNGHGTTQDETAALPWLKKAAAQGDANAEFTLGMAYLLGRGVARDELLATQWIQKAAQRSHPEALQRIREMNPVPDARKETTPPASSSAALLPQPEQVRDASKPRQDLQRLILGLFRKK